MLLFCENYDVGAVDDLFKSNIINGNTSCSLIDRNIF